MGTLLRIVVYGDDRASINETVKKCFQKVDSLNAIFSDYDPQSEISLLENHTTPNQPTEISHDLYQLLNYCKKVHKASRGAFDPTIGPLTSIWRDARKTDSLPNQHKIDSCLKFVGLSNIALSPENESLTFLKQGIQLDFGGIAKGYASDEIAKILNANGLEEYLIDFGGDLLLGNPPPNEAGWVIEYGYVDNSGFYVKKEIITRNCAIASSGDKYQHLTTGENKYSHIIDPRNGYGLTTNIQVTVISATGTEADCLASTYSLVGIDHANAFYERLDSKSHKVFLYHGNAIGKTWTSPNWSF